MFTSTYEVKPKYIERVERLAMICSTDIEDNINELLKNKGWSEVLYLKFCKDVYEIVCKYITNLNEAKLCETELNHMLKQKKRNEKVFLKLLKARTFNFFDIVLQDKKIHFFKNINLLKEIYKLRSDGIGLGEVFLTLFSECESPATGDIKVGDYIIELKGEKGILGCEGYWNNMLSIIKAQQNLTNSQILNNLANIINSTPYNSAIMLSQLRTECGDINWVNDLIMQVKRLIKDANIYKLLLALQIYSYHINNNFDKIIFINGSKALCVEYGSIKDIYNQIKDYDFYVSATNLVTRNKGLSVTLK